MPKPISPVDVYERELQQWETQRSNLLSQIAQLETQLPALAERCKTCSAELDALIPQQRELWLQQAELNTRQIKLQTELEIADNARQLTTQNLEALRSQLKALDRETEPTPVSAPAYGQHFFATGVGTHEL